MSQRNRSSRRRPPAQQGSSGLVRTLIVLGSVVALALVGLLVWSAAGGDSSATGGANPQFTPEAKGAPKLKADRDKIDLGDVKLGQTVQTAFELTNAGDQPLRFTDKPFIEVVEGC